MTTRRPRVLALVRLAGVGLLGAGLIASAGNLPDRQVRMPGAGLGTTDPGIVNAEIACPGAEFTGIKDLDDLAVRPQIVATTTPATALPATAAAHGAGSLSLALGARSALPAKATSGGAGTSLTTRERATALSQRAGVAAPALIAATGALAPGALAAQEADVDDDLVTGATYLACTAPSAQAWLAGGAGEPGRQERLLLTNPGANPVTVDISVFGASGRIEAPAAKGVVVEGRSRTALLLDSLAPQEKSPAFEITTRSGFVSAALADSWIDGITPRGIETVGPLAAPAREQILPGVPGDLPAAVRIIAPGDNDAVVEIRYLGLDGPQALDAGRGVVRVPAGSSRTVPIRPLPRGIGGLQIRSDEPVTAAAVFTPANGRDFGWAAAAAPIPDGEATALISGAVYPALTDTTIRTRTLSLIAPGAPATLTVTTVRDGTATSQQVRVAADSGATLDLSATEAVWVRAEPGTTGVRAAMVLSGPAGKDFALATAALSTTRVQASSIALTPVGGLG